jgi:phage shock protein B
MEDVLIPVLICGMLFIGMPWIILHYITRWKQSAPALTSSDENMLDDMFNTARRLEERLQTIERIIAADNPDFRIGSASTETRELPDYDYTRRN